jgi:hypothetical protein
LTITFDPIPSAYCEEIARTERLLGFAHQASSPVFH